MIAPLAGSDLLPMEQFPLKWRWTDARWNLLPPPDLARIHPLTVKKAGEIRKYGYRRDWYHVYQRRCFTMTGLSPQQFTELAELDDQHNASPDIARAWLSERIETPGEQVWVSFDNLDAVVTDTYIFCRYWDDFCYPSGSNVFVIPFSETWALVYDHEEAFYFGRHAGREARR